jgi:oxygen-independent coproporphyrinogen-3 oxidase
MDSLLIQLNHELKRFDAKTASIESVFIGGGTPSTINAKLYAALFTKIKKYLKHDAEITAEANPNSASKEWLKGMKELGVNRISFGVQSFNDKKLKLLNRAHNKKQAKQAVLDAKKAGFENISIDIIYSVYGDTKELLQEDIETAFTLPINHISAYALTIEESTPFETKPQMSSEDLELTKWIFQELKKRGFAQYEISNFGKYQSIHNIGYWKYKDYIGVGSGAVGNLDNKRYYPDSNIEKYIENPLNIKVEELSDEDMKIEKIFLGLRSYLGIDENIFTKDELRRANILVDEKKLTKKDSHFYNIDFLLADEIALFLA